MSRTKLVGQVDVIDTTTYQVTSIPAGAGSRRLCISPTGDRVYVGNNSRRLRIRRRHGDETSDREHSCWTKAERNCH